MKSSGETQLRAQLELATQQLAQARAANAELEREAGELRETVFELSLRLSETSASQGEATVFSIDDGGFFTPGLEYEHPYRQGDGGRQPRAHRPRSLDTADGLLSSSSEGLPSGAAPPGHPASSPARRSDSGDVSSEGDCPPAHGPDAGGDASGRADGRTSPDRGPLQAAASEKLLGGGRRVSAETFAAPAPRREPSRDPFARPGSAAPPELRAPTPPGNSVSGSEAAVSAAADKANGGSPPPLGMLRVAPGGGGSLAASGNGRQDDASSPRGGQASASAGASAAAHHFGGGRPGLGLAAELRGHAGAVYALKFSGDGDWLCSGGFDTKVCDSTARAAARAALPAKL